MDVLKTTSPAELTGAPNEVPVRRVPSLRTSVALVIGSILGVAGLFVNVFSVADADDRNSNFVNNNSVNDSKGPDSDRSTSRKFTLEFFADERVDGQS